MSFVSELKRANCLNNEFNFRVVMMFKLCRAIIVFGLFRRQDVFYLVGLDRHINDHFKFLYPVNAGTSFKSQTGYSMVR